MNMCISCKYYKSNPLTELGLCKKHNLSMHFSAVQECYEEKINDDNKLLNQINKIMEASNATYIKDFREDIRSLARLLLGSIDGLEFDTQELDILEDLAATNMKKIIDQEISNVKYAILNSSNKISCIKEESFHSYNNNGIVTSNYKKIAKK